MYQVLWDMRNTALKPSFHEDHVALKKCLCQTHITAVCQALPLSAPLGSLAVDHATALKIDDAEQHTKVDKEQQDHKTEAQQIYLSNLATEDNDSQVINANILSWSPLFA